MDQSSKLRIVWLFHLFGISEQLVRNLYKFEVVRKLVQEMDIEFLNIRVFLKSTEKFSFYRKRHGIFSANFAEKRPEFLRMWKEPRVDKEQREGNII